tara:strand:- start:877 stop:1395 length:519 start_codon:yes stop_codon:yes gene_type:complete
MRMYVAFLPADSELLESHILNKAASWVAGADNPMIHAEVVFVDRESAQDIVGRSCSIHYGGKVFLDQKRFSRKQWQFRSVSASREQVKAAFKFCQDHVGDGFNKAGYYLQPFSSGASTTEGKSTWFCSEIVAGALRAAGKDVPVSLHPHKLYNRIRDMTTPDCPRNSVAIKF